MSVEEMYDDFRNRFPDLSKTADARHVEVWGSVEPGSAFVWFENLAAAINAQMGGAGQRAELKAVFTYFDATHRTGSKAVRNCIDVSFVENLFWNVSPNSASQVWDTLPKNLQRLYIDFHGRSPTEP